MPRKSRGETRETTIIFELEVYRAIKNSVHRNEQQEQGPRSVSDWVTKACQIFKDIEEILIKANVHPDMYPYAIKDAVKRFLTHTEIAET